MLNLIRISLIVSSVFIYCTVNGQALKTKYFSKVEEELSLCGDNMILDSTGYFFTEHGCEGVSFIAFGRFQVLVNNRIEFKYLSFDSIAPVREIRRFEPNSGNDSIVIIRLFDRHNKIIHANFETYAVGKDGKLMNIYADGQGNIEFNCRIHKAILFNSLTSIYGKPTLIEIGNQPADIHFNLPWFFMIYSDLTIETGKKMNLVLGQDGLYQPGKKTKVYKLD